MKIAEVINVLEQFAPPAYQESYDNAGLLTGNAEWECSGIICTLDATEAVLDEALQKNGNLVVAHHPILFKGLKKITGKNYVEKAIIKAIKNDVAIYAVHTNIDNVIKGVNDRIADNLGLVNRKILAPKTGELRKLFTFVPAEYAEKVRSAIFSAGSGQIGNYSECSFNTEGTGTFKGGEGSDPFIGDVGQRHEENEIKIEAIFPAFLQHNIVAALIKAHPYEEVAYDIIPLLNEYLQIGSGLTGDLPDELDEEQLLQKIKTNFSLSVIRHTKLLGKTIKKVAVCGGAGSFLIHRAIATGSDFYITSDIKYHEFFEANGSLVVADIGHWESEQYTIDLFFDLLRLKFPNFAVLKTEIRTNPVWYFL